MKVPAIDEMLNNERINSDNQHILSKKNNNIPVKYLPFENINVFTDKNHNFDCENMRYKIVYMQ